MLASIVGLIALAPIPLPAEPPYGRGRRLFERPLTRGGHASGLRTAATPIVVTEKKGAPPPAPADDLLEAASNRTVALLQARENLLRQVAGIDRQLELERDSKRKALTAKYERELRELDDEADALRRPTLSPSTAGSLQHKIAAAVGAAKQGGSAAHHDAKNSGDHVDQVYDIDIDLDIVHAIDTDGDGVITRAEVQGAKSGAAVMQYSAVIMPAIIGCMAGVFCYFVCRLIARKLRGGAGSSTLRPKVRFPAGSGPPLVQPPQQAANSKQPGQSCMRRKHGEKETCGPAIAC